MRLVTLALALTAVAHGALAHCMLHLLELKAIAYHL